MDILKIIGVGFVTAITSLLLRSTKPELSFAVTVCGVIIILLFLVDLLKSSLLIFASLAQMSGVENGLIRILIKIVGVGYLTEFGAGILRDFGSVAVADKVVLAGKITVAVLALPVIESLLEIVKGFLSLV